MIAKENKGIGNSVSRELEFLETDREITKSVVESSKHDYAEQFKDAMRLRKMVAATQTKPIRKPKQRRFSERFRDFILKIKILTGIEE